MDIRHARPFVGVFQKSISIRFINFWRYFPTKTNQWLQERTWDTPTKGLLWDRVLPLCRDFSGMMLMMLAAFGATVNPSVWEDV